MRKKIGFLLISIIVCLTFIQNISAKMCKYTAVEGYYKPYGWSGSASQCKAGKNGCTYHSGQFRNFTASFSLPKTSDYNTHPSLKVKFLNKGDAEKNWTFYDSFKNWKDKQKVNGINEKGESVEIKTYGKEYVVAQKCPSTLLVRTGVGEDTGSRVYIAKSTTEATYILNGLIKSGWTILDESYFFIAENTETSEKEESEENLYTSCMDFTSSGKTECLSNEYFSCLWVTKSVNNGSVEYCNFDDLTYTKCGDSNDIPDKLPIIVSFLVNLIKILTPIILVIVSIISLIKAVSSSKEDEMKKAQSGLITKLIAAALVFFIIQITQFVIIKVADSSEKGSINSCLSCLLNNDCSNSRYYKAMVGGQYQCTYLSDPSSHYDCSTGDSISN